jgi:hypothetical protein
MKTFALVATILCALVTGVQAEPWMQLNPGQGGQMLVPTETGTWKWATLTDSAAQFTSVNKGPQWTLSIRDDGQLEINGKAVEKMSDPEIKSIMQEIVVWIRKQRGEGALVRQYDRQTGYLLQELEKCHKELGK